MINRAKQLVDELTRDHEQVIERQQQRFAKLHDYRLLALSQGGRKPARTVREVFDLIARLPFM